MSNKKFISKIFLTLVLSGILVAAGCSSSDGDDEGGDSSASGDEVVVDIFQFKVEFKEQFEALVDKYEEENPDVKINIKTVGGGNDYAASLKSAFASGDEPDIFNVGGPSDVEDYKDYLADVSDTAAADAALEGTLTSVIDGDKILGLPFNQEGYGFIYNKRVFKDAGINPDDLTTYEAFEDAVETLDSQKEDLGLDAVFALAAKETWVIGNHLANAFIAPEFNHDILDAYNSDTIKFEKGDELKRMLDLQNKYSVQPVLSLDYSQQVEQLFSLEKVAIIKQGNWVYNAIHDMDPELAENNIGMIPIPVEGFEGKLPVGIPMYWGINKKSGDEVVQASKDFLDYMYTSDYGKETVLNDFKFIPAYEGYDTEKIADPLSQEVYRYSSEGNTIGWVFMGAPIAWQEETLAVNMQKYLSGDITWEEALDAARQEWEAARQ